MFLETLANIFDAVYYSGHEKPKPVEEKEESLAPKYARKYGVRDSNGKKIIHNYPLYIEDKRLYGEYYAETCWERGKYNLSEEEQKKLREKMKKEREETTEYYMSKIKKGC